MKTQFLSQKTIISKIAKVEISDNVGLCIAISTGRNRVLGSQMSHYVPENA